MTNVYIPESPAQSEEREDEESVRENMAKSKRFIILKKLKVIIYLPKIKQEVKRVPSPKKIGIVGYWATSISTVRTTVLLKKVIKTD